MPGCSTIWITVGQGPTALAVGAGGGCLDIFFTLIYPFFPLSPSLWETARYRLKYCLKRPLNPKPTNQPTSNINVKGSMIRVCRVRGVCVSVENINRGVPAQHLLLETPVYFNVSFCTAHWNCPYRSPKLSVHPT